jgi:hypothetical protein
MTWAIHNTISKTLIKSNVSAASYSNSPSSLRYSCDVTDTIKSIYSGALTNYGFMVKYSDESINDYNRFYSSDYTTSTVRPTLVVTYMYPIIVDRVASSFSQVDEYNTYLRYRMNCYGYAIHVYASTGNSSNPYKQQPGEFAQDNEPFSVLMSEYLDACFDDTLLTLVKNKMIDDFSTLIIDSAYK